MKMFFAILLMLVGVSLVVLGAIANTELRVSGQMGFLALVCTISTVLLGLVLAHWAFNLKDECQELEFVMKLGTALEVIANEMAELFNPERYDDLMRNGVGSGT